MVGVGLLNIRDIRRDIAYTAWKGTWLGVATNCHIINVLGRMVGVGLLGFLRMLLSCKKRSSSE